MEKHQPTRYSLDWKQPQIPHVDSVSPLPWPLDSGAGWWCGQSGRDPPRGGDTLPGVVYLPPVVMTRTQHWDRHLGGGA